MKTAKSVKGPHYTVSLFPVLSIAAFSLFVLWQWWSHPLGLETSSLSGPLDQSSFFSNRNRPGHYPGPKGSHVGPVHDPEKPTETKGVIKKEVGKCCECGSGELSRLGKKRSLLHNWTDDELYRRVIATDLGRKAPPGREIECSKIDDRWPGRSSRHRLGSGSTESCSSFCARNNDTGAPAGAHRKIAFLFMITTSLPFEPLWKKFFDGKEGLYNVYVHADPFEPNLFSKSSALFWHRLIPSQKAFRGSPSLVQASNRLVANAMLDDPANGYFVLLSGQCIPVRSFDHVYRAITSSGRSFLEQIVNETVMRERYAGREGGEEIMQPEISYDQFRKSAQWFVFLRRHALMVLQDVHQKRYWSKFDHPCAIYFCGTDEHYYPTFFNIVDPDGVTGTSLTFVKWPDYVSEHPVTFKWEDVSRELIKNIQSRNRAQYMFARKFEVDTVDLLMNMTDTILR